MDKGHLTYFRRFWTPLLCNFFGTSEIYLQRCGVVKSILWDLCQFSVATEVDVGDRHRPGEGGRDGGEAGVREGEALQGGENQKAVPGESAEVEK